MYMYHCEPTIESIETTMPRNRSASTSSVSPSQQQQSPALLSRGFASLRRAHRRLSTSSPASPGSPPSLAVNTSETTSRTQPIAVANGDPLARNTSSSNTGHPHIRLVPNVGLSSRSFVFEVIDRDLEPGVVYKIGRFSDRNAMSDRLSFKSKVVSRNHAEIWTEEGKVYIRDIGSSSGTFINRIRLSSPNHVSPPQQIKDGDTIQLGVDYQGGLEPIYRAVRIRIEINRQGQDANSPFTRTAFQQLRQHLLSSSVPSSTPSPDSLLQPGDMGLHREPTKTTEHSADVIAPDAPAQLALAELMGRQMPTDMSRADIQECCICLYAIAPFQALFIAPCSHIFHFKCLRPIVFQNYPGFSCPLCRSYYDLEASVAVEVDEVLEAINQAKEQQQLAIKKSKDPIAPIDTVPELNEEDDDEVVPQTGVEIQISESSSSDQSQQLVEEISEEEEEEEEGHNEHRRSRPIPVEDRNHLAAITRNENLLARTLVDTPTLNNND
ncbi:SMAD/FHA domain-containing protein [Backusella circina FSU 941]|nr:SMAD/FHA domain-containing protein [Backusella circina FSU 941]